MSVMDPQLTTLLEIQDLRGQIRELSKKEGEAGRLEAEQFNIDLDTAVLRMEAKVAELVEELAPPIRRRYEQVAASLERVVVPVIEGVCYGCFVSIATATAGAGGSTNLRSCENCGRFIYILA